MENLLKNHPCFNDEARKKFGRLHLPVAASCNVQCNFCNRKYDCPNESRPGVTSALLTPEQAIEYTKEAVGRMPNISVVGIAGPGDPFATPEITLETLRLVRKEFPEMLLCTASNGLNVAPYVKELKALCVSHVTITVNAVYPSIAAQIYAWVRKDKRAYRGIAGASTLLENQEAAVTQLAEAGITVKINSIVMPGINQDHIVDIAKWAKSKGASIMNCIPVYPVKDAAFEEMHPPTKAAMDAVLSEVEPILPLMRHCTRCRADAAGLLSCGTSKETMDLINRVLNKRDEDKPYIAVASREGILVNQHLGEAELFYIFERDESGRIREAARRQAPDSGKGDARWEELAQALFDCRAVLVSDAGDRPKKFIESKGIRVIRAEGTIEGAVSAVFDGKPVPMPVLSFRGCGHDCKGNGQGCG
jgi:nitrogen fixation protein NifB